MKLSTIRMTQYHNVSVHYRRLRRQRRNWKWDSKSITNYYLATASGSDVTTDTSGWTTTVQTISAAKKYLWNYEVVTYTNGNQFETAPHIIGVYGDQGKPGKDGHDGEDGVDGTDGISMILSNEAIALPCDIEGTLLITPRPPEQRMSIKERRMSVPVQRGQSPGAV